jgi:hypothetical protein
VEIKVENTEVPEVSGGGGGSRGLCSRHVKTVVLRLPWINLYQTQHVVNKVLIAI